MLRWRFEQTCQHGSFGETHILDVFTKVKLGCCRDAEGAAAHIGAVEIKLEYLFLAQIAFKPDCKESLLDLAFDRALIGKKQIFGKLLCESRAALNNTVGAQVLAQRTAQPPEINAVMIEKATVFGAKHSFEDVVWQFVNRHSLPVQDAALADFVTVTVEECDGIIILRAPVLLGFLKGRQREREHDDRADHAERKTFIENLDDETTEPAHPEAPGENSDVFPPFTGIKTQIVEAGVNPGVKTDEPRNPEGLALFLVSIFIGRFTHELYFIAVKVVRRAKPTRQSYQINKL